MNICHVANLVLVVSPPFNFYSFIFWIVFAIRQFTIFYSLLYKNLFFFTKLMHLIYYINLLYISIISVFVAHWCRLSIQWPARSTSKCMILYVILKFPTTTKKKKSFLENRLHSRRKQIKKLLKFIIIFYLRLKRDAQK